MRRNERSYKLYSTTGNAGEAALLKTLKNRNPSGSIGCGWRTAQALADGDALPTNSKHAAVKIPLRNQRRGILRMGPKALNEISKAALEQRKVAMSRESAITRERLSQLGANENPSNNDDDFFGGFGDEYYEMPIDDLPAINDDLQDGSHREYVNYFDIIETLHGPAVCGRRQKHTQTCKEKKMARQAKWDMQEEILSSTYLDWLHNSNGIPHERDLDVPPKQPSANSRYFTIAEVCGYQWVRYNWAIPHTHTQYPSQSLITQGLISNAPEYPNWAVSIRTLQQYHQLRRIKPNFSVQAFVNGMCLAQTRAPTTALYEKFSEAFDIYLSLSDNLAHRLLFQLGRDSPTWRLEHFCAACTESVPGEDKLKYMFSYSVDGGSSAQRWADAGRANSWRSFNRDTGYRIRPEEVKKWEGVVKKRKVKKKKTARNRVAEEDESSSESENDADVELELGGAEEEVIDEVEYIVKNVQGDPTDGIEAPTECTKNFKASAADSKKGMFSCFEESGMFVAVCKHGVLICYCDMIRSGELAKYPLALLDTIEKLHGHKCHCRGYDIWCSFCKTVQKAKIDINGDGTTLAMHGYAHGRICQLKDLPLYRIHLGLADCEQCERYFSSSNLFAGVTRHSSSFHRHQAIKMHSEQNNLEKVTNLGKYIYHNYKQALKLINDLLPIMTNAHQQRGLKPEDYLRMHQEELQYLDSLKKEPDEDSLRCTYIDALDKLWAAQEVERERLASRGTATAATNSRTRNKRKSPLTVSAIMAQTELYLERCGELEMQLDIEVRWTKDCPEYVAAKTYYEERQYRLAAMDVKMLVTQRLMELAKCHMQGTNYKVRTNIAKHLQSRSKTIRTAVAKLNRSARLIGKPTIAIKEVLDGRFLEDFHILVHLGEDVRMKDWAAKDVRILRDQYYKLRCAQTEIDILHVEIDRVWQWMEREAAEYRAVIDRLRSEGGISLASYAERELKRHTLTCDSIIHWLRKCETLDGYRCAPKYFGTAASDVTGPSSAVAQGDDDDEGDDAEEGETAQTIDEMHQLLVNMERQG